MKPNEPAKRDLISTLAAIGLPAFICFFLISLGWRMALVGIGGFVALLLILFWLFPPAIDDDYDKDEIGDDTGSAQ